MKAFILAIIISIPVLGFSQSTKKTEVLYGVFDGRTPCQEMAQQIKEPTTAACIKIKWRLALYKDSLTGQPSSYKLMGLVYKREAPRKGEWKIIKGSAADPNATVYELVFPGKPSIFLQEGDNNILFFLDANKKLLVGNRDFSFVLNRVEGKTVD